MSCWMMDNEFIATVAEGIRQAAKKSIWLDPGTFFDCGEKSFSGHFLFDKEKLARKLKTMNAAAYEGRYGRNAETETDIFPDTTATEKVLRVKSSNKAWGALLKMLDCFLYQCAEDPVYDSEDYKSLEKIRASVQGIVISFNSGYTEAGWGSVPDILKAS